MVHAQVELPRLTQLRITVFQEGRRGKQQVDEVTTTVSLLSAEGRGRLIDYATAHYCHSAELEPDMLGAGTYFIGVPWVLGCGLGSGRL